ncbi:unnamed protein product [Auanema sp. JU1783]|nr:unnamed protein product [Auanema sp. JU1783]
MKSFYIVGFCIFAIIAYANAMNLAYNGRQVNELQKIFGVQPFSDSERRARLIRFMQQPLNEQQQKALLNVWSSSRRHQGVVPI